MNGRGSLLLVGVSLVAFCLVSNAATYSGSLTYTPPYPTDSADEVMVGPSNLQWVNYTVSISWTVTDTDNSQPGYPWLYTYNFTLSGSQAGISHVIIESSPEFIASDITGITGASLYSIDSQKANSGNPNMPDDVFGLKFDPLTESPSNMVWSFYSDRAPVWGDFYARCGGKQGGINFAYNYNNTGGTETGFLSPDTDPSDPASAGTSANHYFYHILRPDTIPEPATVSLVALGALALFCRRKK